MDKRDLTFVQEQLMFLGFQNVPEKEIADKVSADVDKFQVKGEQQFIQFGNKEDMEYAIHFKKYERMDAYHPYMYQATLKDQPERTQAFRMANDDAFTARDAFNLLNGRAVYKWILDWDERRMSGNWFQLDLTEKDVHGNFKLEKLRITDKEYQIGEGLKKYPIKELLSTDDRIKLILALYTGNSVPVTLIKDGKEVRGYVEASPKDSAVKVYSKPGIKFLESKIRQNNQNETMPWEQPENSIKKNKRKGKSI